MAFQACRHRIQSVLPSSNQPRVCPSPYKCPFRGGFKDSGSSTDGATRKVCAIHSLRRLVNILGKSIPSPPSRILLSKDLSLLPSMIGQSQTHTGPSSAKTACSNGHLEAGLGTLPREINCCSALTRLDCQWLQLQTFLHAAVFQSY